MAQKNKPSVKKLVLKKKEIPKKSKQKETKYLRLGGGWSQNWGVIFTVQGEYLKEFKQAVSEANGRLTFVVRENENKQSNNQPDYVLFVRKPKFETYGGEKHAE